MDESNPAPHQGPQSPPPKPGEALRDSEERLRLVLENAVDYAIFSADMARRVTSWNAGAERLLGYSESEILGRSADIIFTDEDRRAGAPELEMRTALAEGRAADDRLHQRQDGSRFWASGALMPMHDAEGQVVGLVKVLRDQSEQRAAQQALEAADAAKDRFLAVLSHELRNPLASISGAAQLLVADTLPTPELARAARVIQRQAMAMKALLGDLLDVSSLRMGRLALRRERVTAQGIVDAAVEATRPVMELGRHRFTLDVDGPDVRLDADPMRMTQVLSNLLSNAAKYTPDGGEIQLSMHAEAGEAVFAVTDNGIGLEPDTVNAMFEMFTQSARAHERAAGGLGIGLALVRNIVELHGGSVTGESEGLGHGSRFTVRIPLAEAEVQGDGDPNTSTSAREAGAGVDDAGEAAQPRVLLADDNADALWSMARFLTMAGFSVETAANGLEALQVAEAFRPMAAVLDIGMPGLDGHEVARRIRAQPWGRDMFLMAATGWSQPEDKRRALEAGFDDHLVKPVAPGDLERMLRARERAEEIRKKP